MITKKNFQRAIWEYVLHGVLFLVFYICYRNIPFYQSFLQKEAMFFLKWFYIGYGVLGLPYFVSRRFLFKEYYRLDDEESSKPTLIMRYLIRMPEKISTTFKNIPETKHFLSIFSMEESTRNAFASYIVKFIYVPLMVSFAVGHLLAVKNSIEHIPQYFLFQRYFDWGYGLLLSLLFLIDTVIFSFGYLFEAKFLKNTIKSVDPYLSGWVVTLICYPPINSVTGRIISMGHSGVNIVFTWQPVTNILHIAILMLYGIYVWSTVALWTKSSNLTNRGIVSHGPYKYVRHPSFASKNIAWWLEMVPYITSVYAVVSLIGWNIIYILRALTEERHLMVDEEYREYVKKVRWRFIPGLF